MRYLKKIVLITTEHLTEEEKKLFSLAKKKFETAGFVVSFCMVKKDTLFSEEKGRLFVTTESSIGKALRKQGLSVLFWVLPDRKQDIPWEMPYCVTDLLETEEQYPEKVYRRYKKIPWDILETRRCRVREMTAEDVRELWEIYKAPEITAYMEPLYTPIEKEIAYTEAYIKNVYEIYEYGMWIITDKNTGRIIGRAGMEQHGGGGDSSMELGYMICRDFQRQGYAYEVCSALMEYGFSKLQAPVITAKVQKENKASCALCRKLGFSVKDNRDGMLVYEKQKMIDKI